nr:hypothetical protein [Tanacetum cinerariifolium]
PHVTPLAPTQGEAFPATFQQRLEIVKLKAKVKKLEQTDKVKSSKLRRLRKEDNSEVQEVVKVVTTVKLITEVVTAAASQVSAASISIPATSATIPAAKPTETPAETLKMKDKVKGIMVETPKPMKKKDQIEMDAEYARKLREEIDMDHDRFNKYQGMKKRPQTESEARKNMMIYLKNTAGYKMDFFKGMTYAQICPIFQARFDENIRKLSEEAQDAEDLRKRLEVVEDEDDDVFVEATPLASKTMFEEPDGQDAIWRNQKSVHGLALVKRWKLLTSCGVHIITLLTIQLFLLVERRYPLSRFTLEQLVNVARLQVEEESKMSLELLRFTRQQLQEYQQG